MTREDLIALVPPEKPMYVAMGVSPEDLGKPFTNEQWADDNADLGPEEVEG